MQSQPVLVVAMGSSCFASAASPIRYKNQADAAFTVLDPHKTFREDLSPMNKFALWTTNKVGTFGFFLIIIAWTIIWLLWNTIGPRWVRFVPYPGFVMWLFMSNVIQITLMSLLLVGQNLSDLQLTPKTKADNENISHIIEQNQRILQHLDELREKENKNNSKK